VSGENVCRSRTDFYRLMWKIKEQERFITCALYKTQSDRIGRNIMGTTSIGRGEKKMCMKRYPEYLKGNDLFVFRVDEIVILKWMLQQYGTGIPTVCSRLSTVISTGWTRQRNLRLILNKRRQNVSLMSDSNHLTTNLAPCN
jgi:hypothetical protein